MPADLLALALDYARAAPIGADFGALPDESARIADEIRARRQSRKFVARGRFLA
jgi:hypothetical protein